MGSGHWDLRMLTNDKKTVLLVNEEHFERAKICFHTDVTIRTDGIVLLGSPIGIDSFVRSRLRERLTTGLKT